jgi:serine/threonine protein kinase/tetratricopeptide (TPR) repeat protein
VTDESLFAAALALPADDRPAYLDAHCPDLAVRKQVEALLAAADASNPLDQPLPDLEQTIHRTQQPPEPSTSVGDRVGPYKLLEKIGEGGMGEVWVADQQEPIKRRVALKLIKAGMDSRSVLGRFEAERQALAVMDHPNIAKVLDAGQTSDGRPYFVMELVKGTPITEFADARKLTPKQRLELFVPVCQAIQHAHLKGIIHRDIKPSNVLVALHDETPVPKVIDFGVAKAVGQQLTDKTIYTGFGALVGTPTYMAPEQATFNQLDVDTRADVYALGVLLYELLAGSPPIEKDRLKKAALDEVLRMVREEEPPRPSQRLSTADSRASIAATRGTEPAKLSALMKGELDWIVMKALEKDRTRRYETANGFAADVQRYLQGEPVQAVPPSVGYRLAKAYRKNKPAVLVGCAFFGLIVGAALMGFLLAVRATDAERVASAERDAAVTAQAEANDQRDEADRQRRRAEEEKRAAEAVRGFLQDDLLRQADPLRQADALPLDGGGGEIKANPTITELLDRAAAQLTPGRIEKKFPNLPFVQAEVLHAVAHGYSGVYQDAKALDLLDRAIPLYLAARGPDDRATLNARVSRATLLAYLGRFEPAEDAFAAVTADLHRVFGAKDRVAFEAQIARGVNLSRGRRTAEGVAHFQRLKELGREYYGEDDRLALTAAGHMPFAYHMNNQPALALREIESIRFHVQKAGLRADHPMFAVAMGALSEIYKDLGRIDDAMQVCREVIDIWVKRGDPFNSNTWQARYQLAWRYNDKKDYPAAAREFTDCLKASDVPFRKLAALDGLRSVALVQGKLDDALDYARQSLVVATAGRPPTERSWRAGRHRVRIGQVLLLQKKPAEAEPFLTAGYQELIDCYDQRFPQDAGLLNEAGKAVTDLFIALGKPDEAKKWTALRLPLHEKDVRQHQEKSPAESRESLEAVNAYAHACVDAGKNDLAVAVFRQTLDRLKAKGCPTDDRSVSRTGEIARAMTRLDRRDLTVEMTGAVHADLTGRTGVPPESLARACFNLGHNLAIDKRPGDGVPHLRESLRLYREIDPNGWLATFSKIWLGTALLWDGKHDEAEKTLLEAYAEAVERRPKAPNWQKGYPETTASRLANLYSATKKLDEAAKWKKLSEAK